MRHVSCVMCQVMMCHVSCFMCHVSCRLQNRAGALCQVPLPKSCRGLSLSLSLSRARSLSLAQNLCYAQWLYEKGVNRRATRMRGGKRGANKQQGQEAKTHQITTILLCLLAAYALEASRLKHCHPRHATMHRSMSVSACEHRVRVQ